MKYISFKLIFRSWRRNKTFAVISILSLAVGIACTNLLVAFVIHEYNVEAGNPNRDKIAVLQREVVGAGYRYVDHPAHIPGLFISKVPELDKSCTVNHIYNSSIRVGEQIYTDFSYLDTDSAFVHLFPQHVSTGSLEEALHDPNKIVLTESFSRRLFGRENPVGQTIQMQSWTSGFPGDEQGIRTFTIAAVIKKKEQDALTFDALIFRRQARGTHFFLLKDHASIAGLQAKTENLFNLTDERGRPVKYTFLSIQDVSLDQELYAPLIRKPNTALLLTALFSAILILAIACFNYINLSFSRIFRQLYSLHIQKLMGAGISRLRIQLFADTFMTVGAGFLIAQLMQYDLLKLLNRIMSSGIPASFLYTNQVLPLTLAFILVLAFIPAWYISSRLPKMSVSVYNNFYRGKAKQRIVASLAIMQFVISLILITGAFSVRRQLSLIYEKTAKYKHIYAFSAGDNQTSMRPLIERVAHFPGIQAIASSNFTLAYSMGYRTDYTENGEAKSRHVVLDDGDEGIMELMGHKIIQGLTWEEAIKLYARPVFLNHTYARHLFPDGNLPVGDMLVIYDKVHKNYPPANHIIAGVVEDYFKTNLEHPVEAAIIAYERDRAVFMQVKTDPEHTAEVIERIYEEGKRLYPKQMLEHKSMYDTVVYTYNKRVFEMYNLLMMYSIISLLLTCFGLFGMALYAIEQRTKEIGIRKVNGSATWQIMLLLNRRFIGWVAAAYVISVPLSQWLVNQWMQRFVYRAGFSIWTYILPFLIVAGITIVTVSRHSYKAASGNPVDALRDE
ncbi:MAG: ABC transporter permease [Tannerella sp.]|jgi:ABC-type antimicrobial peptide transport system permease subunit|nr:ABC transporter permease [Tannerella sp.]